MKGYKVVRRLVDGRKVSAVVHLGSALMVEYEQDHDAVPAVGFCMVYEDVLIARWFRVGLSYGEVWACEFDMARIKPTFSIASALDTDDMRKFWRVLLAGDREGAERFDKPLPAGTVWASRVRLTEKMPF